MLKFWKRLKIHWFMSKYIVEARQMKDNIYKKDVFSAYKTVIALCLFADVAIIEGKEKEFMLLTNGNNDDVLINVLDMIIKRVDSIIDR